MKTVSDERRKSDARRLRADRRHSDRSAVGLRYPPDRRRDGGRRCGDCDLAGFAYNGA